MTIKRFTVVIAGNSGYRSYQVKAECWEEAEEKGREAHKDEHPSDAQPGCAAVIAGWPTVWAYG
ncbi:hypothetical protein [Serratia fonticola]|uniref:Uncharacterized protein n=1 Tax=Serratia fonticola TaxID=47917 RepID=A0AAW3WVA9_SERFO|nr:hypothetical protein [Serratia fonticola]MBC3214776.1 hypothetical protein [Serratia fonticola]NYA15831.1 hypothetical protein [Serratia fonticola]NYA35697.1 hypothetical protein [Serratia fonticola]